MKALVVAVLVGIASCASAPACPLGPAQPNGPPHIWRATKPGSPGTVLLFGTIHTSGIADVAPTVLAALDGSARFASELGDTEPDATKLADAARLPFGQVLDQMLPGDDYFELETTMRGDLKPDQLKHARPWFAMMRLMSHVAPGPRPSMDVALAERAKARHLPIDHLESWDAQIAALDSAVTIKDLSETIHERNTIACSQSRLRAAYLAGDLTALSLTLRVSNNPLLSERNRAWLAQLESYAAQPGTTFVAVGLGHLLGDDSVTALLVRDGFVVGRP